ncbi:MAG: ABC transporter permease [Thermacetogeniaceae bacterium]
MTVVIRQGQLQPAALKLKPVVWRLQPESFKRALQYVILPLAILVVWQGLAQAGLIQPLILPSPTRVAATLWSMLVSGQLEKHALTSILRVLQGFGLAALLGIVLGMAIGLSSTLDRTTDLAVQVLKPIPPLAWIPLAILWFGIDEPSKIFIIFLGAFFPILLNVITGIRNTDSKFVELAKILEVSRWKFIRQVVIPGALPAIMTGLRVGLACAWMCVVAAEMIAASSGVGYLIMDARQLSQTDVVVVGMIVIGVIGKIMDDLIRRLEHRLIGWRVSYQGE